VCVGGGGVCVGGCGGVWVCERGGVRVGGCVCVFECI
jgi:hypothetical protein